MPEIKHLCGSSNRVDKSLHLVPKVTTCQKASHTGTFPRFPHFRQHKPTTAQRGKRPFGLFSRLGIRRGIPVCPCELETILALKSTGQRENYRNSPSSGLDINDTDSWWGRRGHFPVTWVSLQHAGLIKLQYLSGIACFHRLYQARHFPAAGREQLPSRPRCMPAVTTLTTKHVFILLSR